MQKASASRRRLYLCVKNPIKIRNPLAWQFRLCYNVTEKTKPVIFIATGAKSTGSRGPQRVIFISGHSRRQAAIQIP